MNGPKLLMTAECGPDKYRCELRDLEALGVECEWSLNGRVLQTRRFTTVRLAVQWADEQWRAIVAGAAEWSAHWPACRTSVDQSNRDGG
jgi:hypothetical protein